ncbi:F-box only protein 39-like [Saccoglossus kowalevskii]|uniref:F-box only protein 39-like n=1 Tax=Saccoglossus kowalevskii TaxID=10224 RepID=A0ABM0LYT9_SACKO|nr:PREDICTED: F-box only protein 39-like [Saccoglossus kowalevskii]
MISEHSSSNTVNMDCQTEKQVNKSVDWDTLPFTALSKIYCLLDDQSRCQAGSVNSHWNTAYKTPQLWRKRHFKFDGTSCDDRALNYAKSVGRFMRTCTATNTMHCERYARRFQRSLTTYFNHLFKQDTQLRSFSFTELKLDRYFKDIATQAKLTKSMVRFFKTQHSLISFDMSSSWMSESHGYSVLDAVAKRSNKTMRNVNLEDFFGSHMAIYRSADFIRAMVRFTNLEEVKMNYNCVSNDLLLAMGVSNANCWKTLYIKCRKDEPYTQVIRPSTWIVLQQYCPQLSVTMCLDGVYNYDTVKRILNPAIPLKHLEITGSNPEDTFKPDDTLRHLATSFGNTLKSVLIEVQASSFPVERGLLNLVSDCKQLLRLEIKAGIVNLSVMEEVMAMVKDRLQRRDPQRPLGLFKLTVDNMPLTYYQEMAAIFRRHSCTGFQLQYRF